MSSNAQKVKIPSGIPTDFPIYPKNFRGDYQSDMYNGQKHSMEINDMTTTKNLATNYVIFHEKRPLYLVMQ